MLDVEYQIERLDHLGIVAGVCGEVGIAVWLDKQVGESRRDLSVGTAVVAMILRGYNLFITVFSVYLALPFAKSIFSLRKLRNVGSSKQKSRFYQPPSPSEICRDVPARRSISVGWSWLPPGCCPLNSTANRMGSANSTIGGLSICTTS